MHDRGPIAPAQRISGLILAASLLVACAPSVAPVETEESKPSLGATATPAPSAPSASATAEPTPAAAAAAGLALTRRVDGPRQVFVIDSDGSARQVSGLGDDSAIDAVHPMWSPDRSRIAFLPRALGSGPDAQLWVVNADGSNPRAIADVGESISWSPDSSTILFEDSVLTTDTSGEPARIWLVDVESGEATQFGHGNLPAWLPSGEEISYVPVRTGPEEGTFTFAVASLAGGAPRPIGQASGVWWSSDGTLLMQQPDGLYVVEADGSPPRRLVAGYSPVWSPDGSHLVFTHGVTQEEALPMIGVVDREGTVLWSDVVASEPTWSPDGTKLAVEVGYPDVSLQVLDAVTGATLLELEGEDPSW